MSTWIKIGMSGALMKTGERRFILTQKVMRAATSFPTGYPHVVPLAFVVIGNRVYFESRRESVKVRHILKNPRVSLLFDQYDPTSHHPRYRGVLMKGTARVLGFGNPEFMRARRYIYRKYKYFSKSFPIVKGSGRVIVSFKPHAVVSWIYGYKNLTGS